MLIEAAAQSSAAFAKGAKTVKGFLVTCKDAKTHSKATGTSCIVEIEKHFDSLNLCGYLFHARSKEGELLATGNITILRPE
jgi:sialic acid synthase SpsE